MFAVMEQFRFADPLWLLALWVVWGAVIWYQKRQKKSAVVFSSVEMIGSLKPTLRQRLLPIVPILYTLGLTALVVALARPQMGQEEFRVKSEGIAMEICLDRSGSMRAMDFVLAKKRVDRFAAVKKIFRDFVLGTNSFSGRPDDQIGLMAFGGYVDALCPLTLDHQALADMIEMLKVPEPLQDANGRIIRNDILDEETATAIGDALVMAVERLDHSDAKSHVVILLSDGMQTTGAVTPQEAAEMAKKKGVRVYTIGIGTTGVAPFPAIGLDGRTVYVNQEVKLDETTLKQIAQITDGAYFNAQDTRTLEKVCEKIDALEKTEHEDRVFTRYRELYATWLGTGVILISLGLLLSKTVLRVTL